MNNGINLLSYKNKTEAKTDSQRYKKLRIVAVVMLFAVSTFSVMIFILIAVSPLPELNKQYKFASFTLSNSISDIVRLGLVNDRADTIKKIIDGRSQYDKIVESLQKKLPSGVGFETLEIDKADVNIELSSTSLLEIDQFINELSKNDDPSIKFSQITLSKLSFESEKGVFLVNVTATFL